MSLKYKDNIVEVACQKIFPVYTIYSRKTIKFILKPTLMKICQIYSSATIGIVSFMTKELTEYKYQIYQYMNRKELYVYCLFRYPYFADVYCCLIPNSLFLQVNLRKTLANIVVWIILFSIIQTTLIYKIFYN